MGRADSPILRGTPSSPTTRISIVSSHLPAHSWRRAHFRSLLFFYLVASLPPPDRRLPTTFGLDLSLHCKWNRVQLSILSRTVNNTVLSFIIFCS
ncbi:hypothetical protein PUN28_010293 [Cardiocondyla obscurior]|uniref:Uncharacterized protein n=1 Tax=Cardiocondyla obscurior TaxID=286306 RepID=A0AAW2FT68_9HYME